MTIRDCHYSLCDRSRNDSVTMAWRLTGDEHADRIRDSIQLSLVKTSCAGKSCLPRSQPHDSRFVATADVTQGTTRLTTKTSLAGSARDNTSCSRSTELSEPKPQQRNDGATRRVAGRTVSGFPLQRIAAGRPSGVSFASPKCARSSW